MSRYKKHSGYSAHSFHFKLNQAKAEVERMRNKGWDGHIRPSANPPYKYAVYVYRRD